MFDAVLGVFAVIYNRLFVRRKPAYIRFSKHAEERMHCREYDR